MTAQSVTLEQINARITKEEYVVRPHDTLLTFCILTLDNGFTVTGESACADPLKFNEEDGKKYARQAAINKIWPLLGFELKTKLSLSLGSSSEEPKKKEEQKDLTNLTFGEALEALKGGRKVARVGWNGKGMWLTLVSPEQYDVVVRLAKDNELYPWIAMKTATNSFGPWLASQTDMLAEDWMLI